MKQTEKNLDIYEGYPRFYYKQNVYVTLQDGSRIKAMVYIMFNGAKPGRPSERYVDTVYKGYLDFKLDYEFLIDSMLTNNDELKKRGDNPLFFRSLSRCSGFFLGRLSSFPVWCE